MDWLVCRNLIPAQFDLLVVEDWLPKFNSFAEMNETDVNSIQQAKSNGGNKFNSLLKYCCGLLELDWFKLKSEINEFMIADVSNQEWI